MTNPVNLALETFSIIIKFASILCKAGITLQEYIVYNIVSRILCCKVKHLHYLAPHGTAQKMKFSIKHFFSKCYQIHSFLRIWSHLLKKSLMQNFIFCAVWSNQRLALITITSPKLSTRFRFYLILKSARKCSVFVSLTLHYMGSCASVFYLRVGKICPFPCLISVILVFVSWNLALLNQKLFKESHNLCLRQRNYCFPTFFNFFSLFQVKPLTTFILPSNEWSKFYLWKQTMSWA